MKVLGMSGSVRAGSSSTAVLRAVVGLAPVRWVFDYYGGIGDLPHFSPDLDGEDAEAVPTVAALRKAIRSADAVVICTPEYARGVPGSLKNALDWTVSSGDFYDKPTVAIGISPHPTGGADALSSLLLTLRMMGAKVDERAAVSIPFVRTKLTANGTIGEAELAAQLVAALGTLG